MNPAFTPRAADRWRPAMRGFLERALGGRGRRRPLRVRGGLRQALPVADDRDRDGRSAGGRAAAARLVELDPAPVRRAEPDERPRADRAGGERVLRVVRGDARARAAGRPPRRPRLDAARRRAGGRPAVGGRVHAPRAERARGRGGHDPVAARARGEAVRRAPRPVAPAGRAARAGAPGGGRGAALRADHPVHGQDHGRGRRSTAT